MPRDSCGSAPLQGLPGELSGNMHASSTVPGREHTRNLTLLPGALCASLPHFIFTEPAR